MRKEFEICTNEETVVFTTPGALPQLGPLVQFEATKDELSTPSGQATVEHRFDRSWQKKCGMEVCAGEVLLTGNNAAARKGLGIAVTGATVLCRAKYCPFEDTSPPDDHDREPLNPKLTPPTLSAEAPLLSITD